MIPTLSEIAGDYEIESNLDAISTAENDQYESEGHNAMWPELTEMGQEMLAALNRLYGIESEEPVQLASTGA
ncbi:hypothetical protein [Thalassoroseus pseudoceratinae]|uniref:hypothetical protein n=1 Tax=Thalassoroseus pseudoceratinae TaxID=2713176 RepID=UPI00141F3A00|nr:hypothetical protein [Thalassoroseus pseudoceratinae]